MHFLQKLHSIIYRGGIMRKILSFFAIIFSLSGILLACSGGSSNNNGSSHTIGGTVTGLVGTGLVLQDNGADDLIIAANGPFTFATKVANGAAYIVTIKTQPAGPVQTCTVNTGSGTASGDISTVAIVCSTNAYAIGGTVSALTGTGLTLQNNGADTLAINANNGFTFSTPVADNAGYNVTVKTQPKGPLQTCSVNNGAGTVAGMDVSSVEVICSTNAYSVGGTISGLSGTVVLQNNNADDLTLMTNGTFTFSTRVADSADFKVAVKTQPAGQTCTANSNTGTMAGQNVTNVSVVCSNYSYTISGSASGLAGTLVLQNSGTDDLIVTANGAFTFATPVAHGANYAVSMKSRPAGQACSVNNGAGTVFDANITTVSIVCSPARYVTDGYINAVAAGPDGTIYIGGNFTQVGPATGGGVPLDVVTGHAAAAFPVVNGSVNVAAPDGNGGWYIGGTFSHVSGIARNNVAHIRPDNTVDASWNADADGAVNALAVSNTTVYAGGSFSHIGGSARNNIAALDALTGNAISSWDPGANGAVYAFALSGSTLYSGGSFTNIGAQPRSRIAALDIASGTTTSWDPGADNTVRALAMSGSTLYAGGNFSNIGTQTRNYIAALNASGAGIATVWDPNAGNQVSTLVVSGNTVYAGGLFNSMSGTSEILSPPSTLPVPAASFPGIRMQTMP
jgi:hypothetical protein